MRSELVCARGTVRVSSGMPLGLACARTATCEHLRLARNGEGLAYNGEGEGGCLGRGLWPHRAVRGCNCKALTVTVFHPRGTAKRNQDPGSHISALASRAVRGARGWQAKRVEAQSRILGRLIQQCTVPWKLEELYTQVVKCFDSVSAQSALKTHAVAVISRYDAQQLTEWVSGSAYQQIQVPPAPDLTMSLREARRPFECCSNAPLGVYMNFSLALQLDSAPLMAFIDLYLHDDAATRVLDVMKHLSHPFFEVDAIYPLLHKHLLRHFDRSQAWTRDKSQFAKRLTDALQPLST